MKYLDDVSPPDSIYGPFAVRFTDVTVRLFPFKVTGGSPGLEEALCAEFHGEQINVATARRMADFIRTAEYDPFSESAMDAHWKGVVRIEDSGGNVHDLIKSAMTPQLSSSRPVEELRFDDDLAEYDD